MAQTWSSDDFTPGQLRLLRDLRDCSESTLFIASRDFHPSIAYPLRRLGIIEIDTPEGDDDNPIAVGLTEDGEQWVRSLPASTLK